MTGQEFLIGFGGASDHAAQDALAGLSLKHMRAGADVQLLSDAAKALSQNPLLSKRSQSQRLRCLLTRLLVKNNQHDDFARAARGYPPHLRLTVANSLRPEARAKVYGGVETMPASVVEAHQHSSSSSVAPELSESDPDPEQIQLPRFSPARPTQEQKMFSTVLLISHLDHQQANIHLLASADLDPVVVDSISEARRLLATNNQICACVIDGYALSGLDLSGQRSLFEDLASYSSFITIRVHEEGLVLSHADVLQIIKQSRRLGAPVAADAIAFQSDRTIREAELDPYRLATRLLRSHESASLKFGDLSLIESQLLIAAVRSKVRSEGFAGELDSRPLTVRFVPGGQSGARLVTVACGQTRISVAKITSKALALDEILRFRTFLQDWDQTLRPECHFHRDAALILFGLISNTEDPLSPAEPLESRLVDLWNDQWMRKSKQELDLRADFLARGLRRAAKMLGRLNACPAPSTDLSSYVNPPMSHLDALEEDGLSWGLPELAVRARKKATSQVRRLKRAAIVHGDVHLRNLLIRGDSDIHFIDYAASGPGHPAVDLVRLELALYLGPVRQFESETECVEFQRAFSISRATTKELRLTFPIFFQCQVNSACAEGMTAARDEALRVLERHEGDNRDYLATKFLVAWQSLGLIGRQTALARAVITAIADEIDSW